MSDFIAIIPARYSSTRLPGKMLLDIHGKPMIQRVYEQAQKSLASRVIIGTDDKRIYDTAVSFGAEVYMTSHNHISGTDRIQEISQILNLNSQQVVVNVQGDEPLISSILINQVAENLIQKTDIGVSTLYQPIKEIKELYDINAVKVIINKQGFALYFSRAPIPWIRDLEKQSNLQSYNFYRHIGLYAYRVKTLNQYITWEKCQIELLEALEQLRFLFHNEKIYIDLASVIHHHGVDTQKDLIYTQEFLKKSSVN